MDKKLYLAYLGGKMPDGRWGEEHEIVVVAASDQEEAKELAKAKWSGIRQGLHIDCLQEISELDGYTVTLKAKNS